LNELARRGAAVLEVPYPHSTVFVNVDAFSVQLLFLKALAKEIAFFTNTIKQPDVVHSLAILGIAPVQKVVKWVVEIVVYFSCALR